MSDAFGYGLFGDDVYSEVSDSYGYATYGTGVFGTVTIRKDGAAAITSIRDDWLSGDGRGC